MKIIEIFKSFFTRLLYLQILLLSVLLVIASSTSQTSKQTVLTNQAEKNNGSLHRSSVSALSNDAELIAVGNVTNLKSEWDKNKSKIVTRVTISPNETIKGTVPGSSFSIVVPGGEIDGVGEWYSHCARFVQDEDVVVFVKKNQSNEYIIPDGEYGKFPIVKDKITGKKMIPNIGSLETFTAQIKKAINRK